MLTRLLRNTARLAARGLAAANYPRAPERPESLIRDDWEYFTRHLSWYINKELRIRGVPGLSIALVDAERVIWAAGFGYADREQRRPATAETVYQIGSITKVLTAVAVMQAVQQGRLDLDRPLTDYLPEFRMLTRWPQAAAITPRALLCHHAGLPTYLLKGIFSNSPLDDLLRQLQEEHLAFEPHTVFNYSNLGPNLLGLVLARLNGQTYEELMARQVFAPLGMTNTGFSPDGATGASLARGYVHDRPVRPTPIRDVPAGGLYSNVRDLARFMRCLLAGGEIDGTRVLDTKPLDQMFQPQYADRPLNFGHRFGLGWMLSGLPIEHGETQAWHNGGTKAFLSQLALLPDKQLGVAVLANADIAGNLVYETAEQALQLALELRHGLVPRIPRREPELPLPRQSLAAHVGDYSLMGSLARVSLGKRRLRLHVLNHVLNLVPVAANRFRVEYNLLGIKSVPIPFPPVEFTQAEGRRFAVLRDRVVIPAERIPPYDVPEAWRQYTGNYRLLNPDEEYLVDLEHCRMLIEDGMLLMDIRISGIENRQVKVVVVPMNDREACVFGVGRNVGDVATVVPGNDKVRMRYSGYLFEREENGN